MKKRVILCLGGIFALSVGIGSVIMYFTDRDRIINTTTVGQNEIYIVEVFDPPKPGEKTEKAPAVINASQNGSYECTVSCYVRAKVFISDNRVISYLTHYNGEKEGYNLSDWSRGSDGWLYYNSILEKGETTEPVFTHIMVDEDIPDEFSGFTIDVLFESVQSDGFQNAEEAFLAIQ